MPIERLKIPRIDISDMGKSGVVGWYFEPSSKEGLEVIFQCPHNHRSSLKLHSIDSDGYVNASLMCKCEDFHRWVILDKWPITLEKRVGRPALPSLLL